MPTTTIQVAPASVATLLVSAGDGPTLVTNTDLVNSIVIGDSEGIKYTDGYGIVTLGPNGSVAVNGDNDLFAGPVGNVSVAVALVAGGMSNFLGLTQGGGSLVLPSIHSPGFTAGVTGWSINKDGSAEFNNLTIRGTFFGTDFIINSTGLFFYFPTEALGNLVLSISPNGGTGPFGETIRAGTVVVHGSSYWQLHVNNSLNAPASELVTGVASEAEHAAIYAIAGNTGLPAEFMNFWIIGPGSSFDNIQAALTFASNTANNTAIAALTMSLLQNGALLKNIMTWDANGVHIYSPSGSNIFGALSSQTDLSSNTSNGTGFQNLTKIWPISIGDVTLNSGYRITAAGTINMGTTAQPITFCLNVFSQTGLQLPIGAAEFLASTNYWWRAQGEVLFNPVGGAAQFFGGFQVDIGSSVANQATVAATSQTAGGFAAQANVGGFSTLVAGSLALQSKFGSTTGAPSMACRYSVLEPIRSG